MSLLTAVLPPTMRDGSVDVVHGVAHPVDGVEGGLRVGRRGERALQVGAAVLLALHLHAAGRDALDVADRLPTSSVASESVSSDDGVAGTAGEVAGRPPSRR